MQLSILLTKNHRLLSVAAIIDVFETTNRFLAEEKSDQRFDIQFIGLHSDFPTNFSSYPYRLLSEVTETSDLIFIPAFRSDDMALTLRENLDFIAFLHGQFQRGAQLISLCTGSFLLAAGGLLDGRQATTHIEAADAFAQLFPAVQLQPHAIITQSENIYTSGGATSSFHMKLLLIQQHCGREMAVRIAKTFAIDMDRNNQLYFEHFKPSITQEDDLVRAVQLTITKRYGEIRNVEEALDEVPSSRRNIIRRFKQATGMTPIRYLQKTKIEAAKNMLETTSKDMVEVMIASGYNDMKNFRLLFKNLTGLTPKEYRDKFGIGPVMNARPTPIIHY